MACQCLHVGKLIEPLVVAKKLVDVIKGIGMCVLITNTPLELSTVLKSTQLLSSTQKLAGQMIHLWAHPNPFREINLTKLLAQHSHPSILLHIVPNRFSVSQICVLLFVPLLIAL
jgi:hypothetical protein